MRTQNIKPEHLRLLEEVQKIYRSIPERFRGDKKDDPIIIRVIARLLPAVTAVDGILVADATHTWLAVTSIPRHAAVADYIIDPLPKYLYPGPVLLRMEMWRNAGWFNASDEMTEQNNRDFASQVDEIAEATEGARRFLSMP